MTSMSHRSCSDPRARSSEAPAAARGGGRSAPEHQNVVQAATGCPDYWYATGCCCQSCFQGLTQQQQGAHVEGNMQQRGVHQG